MPKLMEQVHRKLRELHYSYRTEQSYSDWIRRFILYDVIPPGMASATLHRTELADHFIPCPDGFCDCGILGLACQ